MKKILLIIVFLPLFGKAQINIIKNMNAHSFMPFQNQLFFSGYDGVNSGLWKTDGTAAGTVFVKSLNGDDINIQSPPAISNNILYFNAFATLWRTDGTESGTFPLTSGISVTEKVDLNGTLIFIGHDAETGHELWKTDGTIQGTNRIIDFLPGPSPGVYSSGKADLVAQGGSVYFVGYINSNASQYLLCKTDGTAAGTQIVDNTMRINSGLYSFQNKIFAVALKYINISPACGTATLYKIIQIDNGVVSDFWLPQSYNIGECGPFYKTDLTSTTDFRRTQNGLFFQAQNSTILNNGSPTMDLRKIDGSSASLVKNFPFSHSIFGIDGYAAQYANDNFSENLFYFRSFEANTGIEPWRSDGTESGTFLLKDIRPGAGSDPFEFRTINGLTYFVATNQTGRQLYQSDGTTAGTAVVADPNNLLSVPLSGIIAPTNSQKNYYSNKLGSQLIFVGQNNVSGSNPISLFSVSPPPCETTLTLQSTTNDYANTSSEPNGILIKQASASNGSITATNKITGTAKVTYQAKSVSLNNGFRADNGTVFKAEIGGCMN
jgi:ELWxxDGT repeat protein